MNQRVQRDREDLRAELETQLGFLRSSADAFDRGLTGESKRMAATLRILLHDKRSSKSLLGQLEAIPAYFVSTSIRFEPGVASTWTGLLWFDLGKPLADRYVAMLDGGLSREMPFEEWWNEIVLMDDRKQTMTRRDLVLTMCDQDGGAHVDPALDEVYDRLSRRNSLGWEVNDASGRRPMREPERYSVRQIAHEVLRTLDPEYPPRHPQLREDIVGGIAVHDQVPDSWAPLLWRRITGRNDPCPCGSGKKFKKCHLGAV